MSAQPSPRSVLGHVLTVGPPLAVPFLERFLKQTPVLDALVLRLRLAHLSIVRRTPHWRNHPIF